MWWREYKDYPVDSELIKEQVEPGKGIVGCEMHEINGWGLHRHRHPKAQKGILYTLFQGIANLFHR